MARFGVGFAFLVSGTELTASSVVEHISPLSYTLLLFLRQFQKVAQAGSPVNIVLSGFEPVTYRHFPSSRDCRPAPPDPVVCQLLSVQLTLGISNRMDARSTGRQKRVPVAGEVAQMVQCWP